MRKIKTYTQWLSEEVAEDGECYFETLDESTDTHSCEPDAIDLEDGLTAVDIAVSILREQIYCSDPSSSQFHSGVWYSAETYEHPYEAKREEQTAHLEGFTEGEEREIYSRVVKS